jgi:CoA-dependent NAD(P)H sulfur oxidoreductase
MSMPLRLLVIGANAAGLSAALRAKKSLPEAEVLVLEASRHVSWGACGIPMNVADPAREASDLQLRSLAWLREQGLDMRLLHRVDHLDLSKALVSGQCHSASNDSHFELSFDRLVIATGASSRGLWWPGLKSEQLFSANTLMDLERLKSHLEPSRTAPFLLGAPTKKVQILILGSAFLGLEMADALADRGMDVCVVDQVPKPLPGFPCEMRGLLSKRMQQRGVRFEGGLTLERVHQTQQGFTPEFSTPSPLSERPFHLLLDCTGRRPATDFAVAAGLAADDQGALRVDSYMRCSHPSVWAAGDCCIREHAVPPGADESAFVWNPQALDANRSGRVAGVNALRSAGGALLEHPKVVGTQILACFGLEIARCGRLSKDLLALNPASPSLGSQSGKSVFPSQHAARHAYQGLLGMPTKEQTNASFESKERRAAYIRSGTKGHALKGAAFDVFLEADASGTLRGGALLADGSGALRINTLATLLQQGARVHDLLACDLAYSPPFGPTFDPLLIAASKLKKELEG